MQQDKWRSQYFADISLNLSPIWLPFFSKESSFKVLQNETIFINANHFHHFDKDDTIDWSNFQKQQIQKLVFLTDDFNCWINVVFALTLLQYSKLNSPKDSNRDYLEGNKHCQQMMENSMDTIQVLNDASEAWHYPVERPSRYRKIHSPILKQQEALFRYKQCDRLFSKGVRPLEDAPSQTITFSGNFRLRWMSRHQHDLLATLDHFGYYKHHQCRTSFHLKRAFSKCLLFGNLFEANLQIVSILSFWSSEGNGRFLFYRDVTPNRFSLFAEQFFRICQAPSIFFELIPFSFGVTGSLPLECFP